MFLVDLRTLQKIVKCFSSKPISEGIHSPHKVFSLVLGKDIILASEFWSSLSVASPESSDTPL